MVVVAFRGLWVVHALKDDLNHGLTYVVGQHWLTSPLVILIGVGHEVGSEDPYGRGLGVCAHGKRLLVAQLKLLLMVGVDLGGICGIV